ncbi:MAG: hypothetical protein ACJ74D_08355 [Gaiellaceae bacterium]
MIRAGIAIAAVLASAGAAAPYAEAAPRFDQLVVFRDGTSKSEVVGTARTHTRASGHRCGVPRATPLAALVRSEVAKLAVRDFSGSCDPASLFVRAIGPDENHGESGWVYKVGNRQGTTSAADPTGPFGSGRLKRRVHVTWFYCVFRAGGCQRTLGLRVRDDGGGTVSARVKAYDDEGRGTLLAGATVHAGSRTAETDANGVATLNLAPGTHRLYAEKKGSVRSFTEKVRIG